MLGSIGDKSILSIDWDSRTLRIVQSRIARRGTDIDQVISVAIPGEVRTSEADSLGGFIAQALSKSGIHTKRALVDVPRDQVNLYTLKLPAASLNDLAGMVAFQIPKELPFPADQAVVDFTVPTESNGDTTDVLVAAVRKEVLAFYTEVFEHAGLKLHRVGLRANANQFAVNALLRTTPHDLTLFVDVGPRTTEIDVIRKGQMVFSRAADVIIPDSLEVGTNERPVAEEQDQDSGLTLVTPIDPSSSELDRVVRELMIEVTRSIEAYRVSEPRASIGHAVIGGSCDIEEALAEAIQRQYKITAQPYNPATCFGWGADQGAAAGAFAATLGLVLAQGADAGETFNFLAPKRPVSRTERRIKKAPLAAAAAVVFVIAGAAFYHYSIRPQYQIRDRLRGEIADVEKVLAENREFTRLVEAVGEYENHRVVWLDKLRDLVTTIPEQKRVALTSVDCSQKELTIKLPFTAKDSGVGSEMVAAIEAFREEGVDYPRFKASTGTTSVKSKQSYPHSGSVEISIVDREGSDDGKKSQ